jgi:hypothetical protein
MTLPLIEHFRIHPAFVLTTENSAWGCSIRKAALNLFPRINQQWRNIETTRTYCIHIKLHSIHFRAVRWLKLQDPAGLCEVLSMLKILGSVILISSTVFSNISKIVSTTTLLNPETLANDVNSGCREFSL